MVSLTRLRKSCEMKQRSGSTSRPILSYLVGFCFEPHGLSWCCSSVLHRSIVVYDPRLASVDSCLDVSDTHKPTGVSINRNPHVTVTRHMGCTRRRSNDLDVNKEGTYQWP